MCVLIQSYNRLTITTSIMIINLVIDSNISFVYGFIIVITISLFMGHVLSCWIVSYFYFILNLRMPFPWFFILFVIYDIDVIVSKCYPGWLPSLRQAGQPWGTLLLSGRIPQTSCLWDLIGDTSNFAICVGLF